MEKMIRTDCIQIFWTSQLISRFALVTRKKAIRITGIPSLWIFIMKLKLTVTENQVNQGHRHDEQQGIDPIKHAAMARHD